MGLVREFRLSSLGKPPRARRAFFAVASARSFPASVQESTQTILPTMDMLQYERDMLLYLTAGRDL